MLHPTVEAQVSPPRGLSAQGAGPLRRLLLLLYATLIPVIAVSTVVLQWRAAPHGVLNPSASLVAQLVVIGLFIVGASFVSHGLAEDGTYNFARVPMMAALLIFPAPYPAMLTLLSVGAYYAFAEFRGQTRQGRAGRLGRYAVTLGIAALVVAVPGEIIGHWKSPAELLAHGAISDNLLPLLLLAFLFSLDIPLERICTALDTTLTDSTRPGIELLGHLAMVGLGMIFAQAWSIDRWSALLFALPAAAIAASTALHSRSMRRTVTAEQRVRSLEVVLTAAQQIGIEDDPSSLLRPIAEAASEVARTNDVAVYASQDNEPGWLTLLFSLTPKAAAPPTHVHLTAVGRALLHAGSGTYLVPIGHLEHGRPRACLRIAGAHIEVGSEMHHTLSILAIQAAAALENADAHRFVLSQAHQDGLTGLLNHRTFQTRLQQELARTSRAGQALSLIMIDLDDFSSINNTYGHPAGDAVLLHVADALRNSVREGDIPARYAGDEFAVILPDAESDTARITAERICTSISNLLVEVGEESAVRVSCSLGVSSRSGDTSREDLIQAADQAAYVAKRSGKGRVAGEEEVQALPDLAAEPYLKAKRAHR